MTREFMRPYPRRDGPTARILATALAAIAMVLAAFGVHQPAQAETLVFEGRVEAYERAELSSQLDGVVAEILFVGGEMVSKGQVLIRLDADDADLAKAEAAALMTQVEADVTHARQEAERVRTLVRRGIATQAQQQAAQQTLSVAEARLASARVAIRRADLDLARTTIEAGISGIVDRPRISKGAYVEAESGAPLGEIVRIDPALIAYQVPYATRIAAMRISNAPDLQELFKRIQLTVRLPGGEVYPHPAKPDFASATIDAETGLLTVWAAIPNPKGLLRPGLAVSVTSEILANGDATQ